MAARKSRNSTRETTARATQRVNPARDEQSNQQSSQQSVAVGAEAAATMLRGAAIWSELQMQAIQRSAQTWRNLAERLRTATTPLDIIGAQKEIMTDAMLQLLQFTQDLVQASSAAQPALGKAAGGEAGAANAAAQDATQAPMLQAWQAMVNPLGLVAAGSLNGDATRATH